MPPRSSAASASEGPRNTRPEGARLLDGEALPGEPVGQDLLAAIQAVTLAQADQGLGTGAPLPAAQRGDRRERKLRVTDRQAPLEHEPCRPPSGRGVKPLGLELQQYLAKLQSIVKRHRTGKLCGRRADHRQATALLERAPESGVTMSLRRHQNTCSHPLGRLWATVTSGHHAAPRKRALGGD